MTTTAASNTVLFGTLGAIALLFSYARWIEPTWIEVTRHKVEANVPEKITIAHVSDLHIRELGQREAEIQRILENENPDAVFITGDSIAENANYEALDQFLAEVHAPLGVWTVKGNWEHWHPNHDGSGAPQTANIKLLNNSAAKLTNAVWIIGVDDESAGTPNLRKATMGIPKDAFRIGLFHSPAFFDRASKEFDLALAGHTHGGQIRMPFLPPLWLPEGSGRFVSGWYANGQSRMYVSRGLGNSILDFRLACRPELAIIEIGK